MAGTIPGASGFLNAATLANSRGIAAAQPSLLDGGFSAPDLLEVGRRINRNSVGLSSNARAANKRFLESSTTNFNAIFSLNVGTTSSVEALQQGILALRSGLSDNQIARSLRQDDGGVGSSATGSTIDTEA